MRKLTFILLLCISIILGKNSSSMLNDFLVNQFAEKYDISTSDIGLKLFHVPDMNFNNVEFKVSTKGNSLKLGYNRTYIQMLKNSRIENEFQITYSVKIEVLTPVLKHDVKFGKMIKTSDLSMKKRTINNNYDDYFRNLEIEDGMVAKALLREGEILKRSDLKIKPVINRGQEVGLKVYSGNILIELEGIAKESGSTGEKIRVYNRETRRHYFGTIESPQFVVINVE